LLQLSQRDVAQGLNVRQRAGQVTHSLLTIGAAEQ
jgi:hypothetical protein